MKAIHAVPANPSNLEELAAMRMSSLGAGAGFHAYANIVRQVDSVLIAEDRAARARARAFLYLQRLQEENPTVF